MSGAPPTTLLPPLALPWKQRQETLAGKPFQSPGTLAEHLVIEHVAAFVLKFGESAEVRLRMMGATTKLPFLDIDHNSVIFLISRKLAGQNKFGIWEKLVQKPLMETSKGAFVEADERKRPSAFCFGVMFCGEGWVEY